MAKLSKEERERGVITSSAGNHAQGVALAAGKLVRGGGRGGGGGETVLWLGIGRASGVASDNIDEYLSTSLYGVSFGRTEILFSGMQGHTGMCRWPEAEATAFLADVICLSFEGLLPEVGDDSCDSRTSTTA